MKKKKTNRAIAKLTSSFTRIGAEWRMILERLHFDLLVVGEELQQRQ